MVDSAQNTNRLASFPFCQSPHSSAPPRSGFPLELVLLEWVPLELVLLESVPLELVLIEWRQSLRKRETERECRVGEKGGGGAGGADGG